MKVTVTIKKNSVYELIEGLTANIGKKNPGVGFEAMWASQGDEATLDIFWDEAKNDLEATVQHWLEDASSDRNDATGDEQYGLVLKTSGAWPFNELNSLLQKSVMQYLVHATLAGWLSIMPKLQIDVNYGEVATAELGTIVGLLLKKKTTATVADRHSDNTAQTDVDGSVNAEARHTDTTQQADAEGSVSAGDRHTDTTQQADAEGSVSTEARHTDTAQQTDVDGSVSAGDRHTDTTRQADVEGAAYAGTRHKDVETDDDEDSDRRMGARHNNRDHVPVRIEHESLNMSGEYGINSINAKRLRHGKETDQNHHQPWRGVPGHHHGLQPDLEAAWSGCGRRD